MADISTVFINNTTYNIKDSTARAGLTNVYTKAETDAEIASAIGGITGISFEVVSSLPATGEAGTIYLLSNSGSGQNIYDEYVWLTASNRWEKIGTTDVDLSGYAQTADLGDLAFKDSATGSFTPSGSISPTTATVNSITAVGSLPTWSASVTNEVLSFSFNQGSLPTKGANQTVMTGASFSGTAGTVSVS